MDKKLRMGLIIAGIVLILASIVTCAVVSERRGTPAPAGQVEVDQEDCDAEDRAKKQWWECGPGVLDPQKTTKPLAPRTTKPRVTRQ